MKKIITTLVLAVATLGVAQAQEFKVGVKAGGLFSDTPFKKQTKERVLQLNTIQALSLVTNLGYWANTTSTTNWG